MTDATEIRIGDILRIENTICKVIAQEIKGTGKFGKTVHLKLKSLSDGHLVEKSLRAEEKVEDVEVHRVKLQYLYRDTDQCVFMNNQTYEQISIPAKVIGRQEVFLREDTEMNAIFSDDKALSVDFPKSVELKVTSAPPGVKGQADTTYKEVQLENGLKVLAPQFVKEGESIRIDTENFTYLDRVPIKSMKTESSSQDKVR